MASGLALGREGPTVQMGGAVGAAVAEWMQTSSRDRLILIAAGAGAGLAAAFNAPLAGVIFVLEEVQRIGCRLGCALKYTDQFTDDNYSVRNAGSLSSPRRISVMRPR